MGGKGFNGVIESQAAVIMTKDSASIGDDRVLPAITTNHPETGKILSRRDAEEVSTKDAKERESEGTTGISTDLRVQTVQ